MTKEFSFSTVTDFDEHIAKSVSMYGSLTALIPSISMYFVQPKSNVYDLGCSTGKLLLSLAEQYKEDISFVGYDNEANLLPDSVGNVQFYLRDINDPNIKFFNTSFITAIFTLQFIDRVNRRILIKKVHDSLTPGGAFIVAEKYYAENGQVQDIFNFSAFDKKRESFSAEEILDKQLTLRTIMRPLSDNQNREELISAGFKIVTPFWLSLNFIGYICIKG